MVVRRHTLQHNKNYIIGVMVVYHEWRSSGSFQKEGLCACLNLEKGNFYNYHGDHFGNVNQHAF